MQHETAVQSKKDLAQAALNDNDMPMLERIKAMSDRQCEITDKQLRLSGILNFDLRIEQSRLMQERASALDSGNDEKIIISSKKIKEFSERFNSFADEKENLSKENREYKDKIAELENRLHGISDSFSYPADGRSGMPYQGKGVM